MGLEARLRRMGLVTRDAPRATRVALGYCFGTLHWPFVRSLQALNAHRAKQANAGHETFTPYEIPQQGIYVDENRNCIVQRFMKSDADWLLQIDTDIEFPPDLPETMVALAGQARKILAASVPLGPPIPSSAMMFRKARLSSGEEVCIGPGTYVYLREDEIPEAGIEVDCVASAVLLVHREVFTAIADKIGQAWFLKGGPGSVMPDMLDQRSREAWSATGRVRERKYIHIGEDVLFCLRAADAGYRPWCVKVPGLRHYKALPLTHDVPAESEVARAQEAAR